MGAFICKQPNGKYCRFSTIVDTITNYIMTAEEHIELCKQKAEKEAKDTLKNNLQPFILVKIMFNLTRETVYRFN